MPARPDAVLARAESLVGAHAIRRDPATLTAFGSDMFHVGAPPLAVICPDRSDDIAPLLRLLAEGDLAYAPVGGGTSYSAGWLVDARPWIAIDMRGLCRVLHIDPVALTITAEAGCTWAALRDAAGAHGLRLPVQGPDSGRYATLGGGLAGDAVFHGSAAHGRVSQHVRALDVARSDGSRLRLARGDGPGLIGAFLGDGGALGVKLSATVDLIPLPAAERCLTVRFATFEPALAAMAAILRSGLASDCVLLDPAVMSLVDSRVADMPLQPGRLAARDAPYAIAVAIEAASPALVRAAARIVTKLAARQGGAASEDGPLADMRAALFAPLTLIGDAAGGVWVPANGIAPASQALAAIRAVESVMATHAAAIARAGLRWSLAVLGIGRAEMLIEPGLRWIGRATPFAEALRPAAGLPATAGATDAARPAVEAMRAALVNAFADAGLHHLQHGRLYPAPAALDPGRRALFAALRETGDPGRHCNPGVLGL